MSTNGYVEMMKAEGWKVYTRDRAEYCYCTDGTNIAYVQWSNLGDRVTTVHKPNRTTGTGFSIAETITPQTIRTALQMFAPNWADSKDRRSVRKYKDWEEFHHADSFNAQLREVTA